MKFGPVPVEMAAGKIMGHNIAGPDGKRLYRKGKLITPEVVQKLISLGKTSIYIAELEVGDVTEDQAALRIAQAVTNSGLRLSGPSSGRVNLLSTVQGVFRVNESALLQINQIPGLTLATLPDCQVVHPRQIVATVKVIPYAVPQTFLEQAEHGVMSYQPVLCVAELLPKKVAILLSGSDAVRERLVADFEMPLRERVEGLGSQAILTGYLKLEDEDDESVLSNLLLETVSQRYDLIILAGETAIMDRNDIVPRAVERAGGVVECVGVPVDPGNLLMLAYLGDVSLVGAPGCARSLKTNALDWVLPRLLAGERLSQIDLAKMGQGGLLEDTAERPMPRDRLV